MTYGRELNLQAGDRIRVSSPARDPFPVGWAEGTIISAHYYDDGGWYVELEKDNVSYGWQTGYGYFKEREDEITIEKLESSTVIPDVCPYFSPECDSEPVKPCRYHEDAPDSYCPLAGTARTVEPKYPTYIMDKVRQRLGLEPGDTSRDEEINNMTHDQVFAHCLMWEGILGYEFTIRRWITEIYGVTLT